MKIYDTAVNILPAQRSGLAIKKRCCLINFAYIWSKESNQFPFSSGLTNEYDETRTHHEWWVISKLKTTLKLMEEKCF